MGGNGGEAKNKQEALKGKVEQAIEKVLEGGQSYKIGSRSLARADLGELRKLKAEIDAGGTEDGGALDRTYVASFDRR